MPWHARLQLDYQRQAHACVVRHAHDGPLRVFKSLYPEGPAICHNVIVHPPGGIVGGDMLDIRVTVDKGAHGLISTPGATRFYASDQEGGHQQVHLQLADGARLEWLPLETLAFPGCLASNHLTLALSGNAEMIGWDVVGLGLPQADMPFTHGRFEQHIEWPGVWLERATLDGSDLRLLDSPVGLGGHRCMGTMWLASAAAMGTDRQERLLESVRETLPTAISPTDAVAAATCPNPHLLVVRALAPLVEPMMLTLQRAWSALRQSAWGLEGHPPRIWQV